MNGEQTPEDIETGRKRVKKILSINGIVFTLIGLFLLLKGEFSDLVVLENSTDFYLGVSLFFVGIADYIVAQILFSDKKSS